MTNLFSYLADTKYFWFAHSNSDIEPVTARIDIASTVLGLKKSNQSCHASKEVVGNDSEVSGRNYHAGEKERRCYQSNGILKRNLLEIQNVVSSLEMGFAQQLRVEPFTAWSHSKCRVSTSVKAFTNHLLA